jgi:hypothetical protein
VLQGDILDGRLALSYHVLQALWLQTIIDLEYMEIERSDGNPSTPKTPRSPTPHAGEAR